MRKVNAAVCAFFLMFTMTGCGSLELSQREIIDAVGIDYGADGYTVTLAAFETAENKNGYKLYSQSANSLQDAFDELSKDTMGSLMYENNALIMLGSDAYRYQYESIMSFLLSSYEGELNTQVVGLRTKAEETINTISTQGMSFARLVTNLTDEQLQRWSYSNPIYKCAPDQSGKYGGQLLPILEMTRYPQNENSEVKTEMSLYALALISKNGWAADIRGEEMNAVMLLQNKIKKIPIQVFLGEKTVGAHLQDPHIRISRNHDHKDSLTVSCTSELVVPNSVSDLSEQDKKAIRMQAQEYLKSIMEQCVLNLETAYEFDVIGAGYYAYLTAEKSNSKIPPLTFYVEIK